MLRASFMNRVLPVAATLALLGCEREITNPNLLPTAGTLSMMIVSGNNQTGPAGLELPLPLVVKVVDANNRAVKDQLLNFVVTAGGGRPWAGTARTNTQGIAREWWTLGTVAGTPQTLEVRAVNPSSGAKQVFGTFTATAVPGPVATVDVTPDSVGLARAETAQLTATAADQYGNPIANPAITWSSNDLAVATVDQAGLVTGVGGGTAGVMATIGIASASAVVSVTPNLIFFESARTGAPEIYSIRPDGTAETQLTTSGGTSPDLSSDNATIAFVRGWNIWLMNLDGSNQRQLTSVSGQTYMSSPRWAPDGSLIAFWMEYNSTNLTAEIYVVHRDGSGLRQLTSNSGVVDIHPGWTPDGRVHWTAVGGGLRVINADGTGEAQMVAMAACGLGSGGYAQFAPDGSKILYEGEISCGGAIETFLMDLDGSNRIRLTNSGSSRVASWSPDGSRIVYSRSDVGGAGPFQLYLMNADGSNPAPLSTGMSDALARWR